MRIAASIVRQHVELAAFLWAQRDSLAGGDPPDTGAIAGIDARLEANLDAISIAGEEAWPLIIEQYKTAPGKGELFVAAVHALARGEERRIGQVMDLARAPVEHEGLLGALAWLTPATLAPAVRAWMTSSDGFCRYLAVSAFLRHAADPGPRLAAFMDDADGRVRGQAFRLAGRLHRKDVLERVRAGLADADPDTRLWAASACVQMGAAGPALVTLKSAVVAQSPHAVTALRSVLVALPAAEARQWLKELAATPGTRALAVRGVGIIGDQEALGWLVQRMGDIAVAAPAAAAFLEIFGPIEDADDYFYGDSDRAAEALGIDPDEIQGRIPIAAAFAALIER